VSKLRHRIHFDGSDNKPCDGLSHQSPREIGTALRYAVRLGIASGSTGLLDIKRSLLNSALERGVQMRQFRVVHGDDAKTLEKELNQAASEGFEFLTAFPSVRLAPCTLSLKQSRAVRPLLQRAILECDFLSSLSGLHFDYGFGEVEFLPLLFCLLLSAFSRSRSDCVSKRASKSTTEAAPRPRQQSSLEF